jgi:hypothetical protein
MKSRNEAFVALDSNYKLFIGQICFEEDGNYSAGQETPLILRNPSSHLRVQKSRHLGPK